MSDVVEAHELRKSFKTRGREVEAVRGVSFAVPHGEIFGFLGPNGAGKTTTLRMLTTLLEIDAGEARVAGIDVARTPGEVRARIGYVSQLGGADNLATGRENLMLQGRLYGCERARVAARVDELLGLLDLASFGTARSRPTPAASAAGSTSRSGSSMSPRFYSLMSRPPDSIRKTARTCGSTCARCATAA